MQVLNLYRCAFYNSIYPDFTVLPNSEITLPNPFANVQMVDLNNQIVAKANFNLLLRNSNAIIDCFWRRRFKKKW